MIPISGERPPYPNSRDWRTPTRCAIPGAARRTPSQTSKTMLFVLSYCFLLFCHLCYPISAELKTISREDAHLMYPRYLRVFLYMFNDLLPTPPPNLCENGLGVSLSCTCAAFSLFAKLNWFFPKKYDLLNLSSKLKLMSWLLPITALLE
jgi:hypothetical protein